MKIALIIEHFDATRGGAEHFTVWLARQLAERGHEVHVVCHDVAARVNKYRQATQRASHDADRSHQAIVPEEVGHAGIHIHRIRGMRLNSGIGFRLFGRRAQRWCELHKPDVVHSMTVAYPGDIYQPHAGVYAAMQTQAIAARGTEGQATWKRWMLRLSGKQRTLLALERRAVLEIRDANEKRSGQRTGGFHRGLVSLCPMMTGQLRQHYGVGLDDGIVELANPRMEAAEKCHDEKRAKQRAWFRGHYKIGENDRVAVFVGHDFRRKGLRFAIEAVARTKEWKLLVVGLGKAREYVELAQSLGIGEGAARPRVLFVGPTKEMEKVYAASDALILPTFYDSFGLVVLEALSHGLPVVSTAFLGAAYLVNNHKVGVIVSSPKDVEGMAGALEGLPAAESMEGKAMAERALTASGGMLGGEYVDRMVALYENVRSGRR